MLKRYEAFMEQALRARLKQFPRPIRSRYATFTRALEYLQTVDRPFIVELGTSRSFVGGVIDQDQASWNPADPAAWDHGAGLFTYLFGEALQGRPFELHSVDVDPGALRVSQHMTRGLSGIVHRCQGSTEYLGELARQAHLIYMDQGDTGLDCALLHARDAVIVVKRDLVVPGGIVLVDDVRADPVGGKGVLSVGYLKKHGFTLVMDEYQALLRKSSD